MHLVQRLRDKKSAGSMIIFVKTCKTCEVISMMLNYFEFPNVSLHSQKSQRERLASLVKFRSNQVRTRIKRHQLFITPIQLVWLDISLSHSVWP